MARRMTYEQKIEMAKSININVQEEINPDSCIRGVYGFYAVKDMEEIPFYVGKSINIFCRMFKGGHISDYLSGVRKNGVQKRIKEYLEKGYVIKVRILRKVEYIGDGFVQDANRLALAELEEIVRMLEQGYCLTDDQISEAVKTKSERQVWNDKFEN